MCSKFYGSVKKTKKNQKNLRIELVTLASRFRVQESLNINQQILKKIYIMNQIIYIENVSEFNLLKEKVEKFGQQSKSLDNVNRRLKHLIETEESK